MAKKRGEKPKMPATATELRPVRLLLTSDDHQRFRVEAAREGRTMAAVARRLVEEYLAHRKAGK